jgi:uncharacterized membrane protein
LETDFRRRSKKLKQILKLKEGRHMQWLKILSMIFVSMFLFSCGTYFEQKIMESKMDQSEQEKLSSDFQSVNQAIFSSRCVSCHQQYSNYQGVIRELSAIQATVVSNRMPKSGGPLTENQKSILFAWIAKGAPDQAGIPSPSNPPVQLEANWKSISENVIFPKCLVCHNPQGQAKFLDLSNRQIIFESRNRVFAGGSKFIDLDAPEKSYLLQILNDDEEPMPPTWSNIPRLTTDELKTLSLWLSLGLPE